MQPVQHTIFTQLLHMYEEVAGSKIDLLTTLKGRTACRYVTSEIGNEQSLREHVVSEKDGKKGENNKGKEWSVEQNMKKNNLPR